MNNPMVDKPNNVAPSELENKFKEESSLRLTGLQWLVIFNVLNAQSYKLGDAEIVLDIIKKVKLVVPPPQEPEKPVATPPPPGPILTKKSEKAVN